jgi:hypothetical protein
VNGWVWWFLLRGISVLEYSNPKESVTGQPIGRERRTAQVFPMRKVGSLLIGIVGRVDFSAGRSCLDPVGQHARSSFSRINSGEAGTYRSAVCTSVSAAKGRESSRSFDACGTTTVFTQRTRDACRIDRVATAPSTSRSSSASATTIGRRSVMPVLTGFRNCSKSRATSPRSCTGPRLLGQTVQNNPFQIAGYVGPQRTRRRRILSQDGCQRG